MEADIEVTRSHPAGASETLLRIGVLYSGAGEGAAAGESQLRDALELVQRQLASDFGEYRWELPVVTRRAFPPWGEIPIMELIELGAEFKTARRWDYALVIVPNGIRTRHRVDPTAVPSSALETAVISTEYLPKHAEPEQLAALLLFVLGRLWGLRETSTGLEHLPVDLGSLEYRGFTDEERAKLTPRLQRAADARLEELGLHRLASPLFYVRAFASDARGILADVFNFRPWRLPLYLGRLTAASVATVVFIMLTAEAWEVAQRGTLISVALLSLASIAAATAQLYVGQNFGQISRARARTEQLARTRLVLALTLSLGMSFVWLVIFFAVLVLSTLFPSGVLAQWSGGEAPRLWLQAAFTATVGVLAASFGGNLEEEADVKAELVCDEEL